MQTPLESAENPTSLRKTPWPLAHRDYAAFPIRSHVSLKSMAFDDANLKAAFETWLSECRRGTWRCNGVPYVPRLLSLARTSESGLFSYRNSSSKVIEKIIEISDGYLSDNPNDLHVRLALLVYICAVPSSLHGNFITRGDANIPPLFNRVVSACKPDLLEDRANLLFETHNSYLAGNWGLAKNLFARIRKIGIYSEAEASAVEGHFWFLSVFGHRILSEWSENDNFVYEFHWIESLSPELHWGPDAREDDDRSRSWSFTFPEPLIPRSDAHWLLTAWCSNPRFPTMLANPAYVERLDFSKVDIDDARVHDWIPDDPEGRRKYFAKYYDRRYRNFEPLRPLALLEDQKERLEYARDCLLMASNLAPALAQPYEVLLGSIFFHLEHYEEAFSSFGRAYARGTQFRGIDKSVIPRNYDWELSYFCALCRRLQGNYEGALETLKELYHSTHGNIGAAWWIARWLLEKRRFDDAANWLRAEMKSGYLPAEDWQLSALLAFAEFADSDLQVDAFDRQLRDGNPGLHQVVVGLSQQFCPELDLLSEESSKHWLAAVTLLHTKPLFEMSQEAVYAKVLTSFAVIAEHEIKRYLFLSFAARMKDPTFAEIVRREGNKYDQDKLLKFLRTKDHFISLNGMGSVIRECQNSTLKTHLEFRRHLDAVAPRLIAESDHIRELAELRDPPSHAPTLNSRRDAVRAAELCVTLIRCLGKR